MSDTGRQSLTDKATSCLKPDSQKGPVESVTDEFKGAMDSVAGAMQPNSQKSGSQRVSDSTTGNSYSDNKDSMLDKAKNAVGMGNNNGSSCNK